MPTWHCEGCDHPVDKNNPDAIVDHVRNCPFVDGAGHPFPVMLRWSEVHWYTAVVSSADLAEGIGVGNLADLTELSELEAEYDGDEPEAHYIATLDRTEAMVDSLEIHEIRMATIEEVRGG